MLLLVLLAYLQLIYFDFYLARRNFTALYRQVRDCSVRKVIQPPVAAEKICAAFDTACIWYWKEVLCLQRSAATVCLLRRYGVPAQMMIGVQQMPFKAHAWVEIDRRVANDKPYVREIYTVLDRC